MNGTTAARAKAAATAFRLARIERELAEQRALIQDLHNSAIHRWRLGF